MTYTAAENQWIADSKPINGYNDSDLVFISSGQFSVWVNGSRLAVLPHLASGEVGLSHQLKAFFPFKRLASATSSDHSASYLYHQINGTTIAEEMWDALTNQWLPSSYITVPNP